MKRRITRSCGTRLANRYREQKTISTTLLKNHTLSFLRDRNQRSRTTQTEKGETIGHQNTSGMNRDNQRDLCNRTGNRCQSRRKTQKMCVHTRDTRLSPLSSQPAGPSKILSSAPVAYPFLHQLLCDRVGNHHSMCSGHPLDVLVNENVAIELTRPTQCVHLYRYALARQSSNFSIHKCV